MANRRALSLIGYLVSAYIFAYHFFSSPNPDPLICVLWVMAMFKRAFECSFIHIWSKPDKEFVTMMMEWMFWWGFANMIGERVYHESYVATGDLSRYLGIVVFLAGFILNFYVHLC
jgi:hypothetical protein